MERPQQVPEEAVYVATNKEWQLGNTNEVGHKIGLWKTWHETGYLRVTVDYSDTTLPFHYQRFHPDGTLAEEGDWYGGSKFLGILRHIKSDNSTIERFPTGLSPKVWIVEYNFIDELIYDSELYFDRKGNLVSRTGELAPAVRPANVPARAHFVKDNHSPANWAMGILDCRVRNYVGEYTEWDKDGKLVLRRIHNKKGTDLEKYHYKNGLLDNSQVYDEHFNYTGTYYYKDLDPVVMERQIFHRKDKKDQSYSYFNRDGKLRYSAREEKVSDTHICRYYNSQLVCEGINTGEIENAVMDAKYYLADGTVFIDFTSQGKGTGVWNLYETGGKIAKQIAVSNNDVDLWLKRADVFMPDIKDYNDKTTKTDWDAVKENFEIRYQKYLNKQQLNSQVEIAPLRVELEKVDWETIDTPYDDASELPLAIYGMLAEDEAIAKDSAAKIWTQIEHQESVYEATYIVAGILGRMLPFYKHLPVVQLRLLDFLYDVFNLYYINSEEDLYTELTKGLKSALPTLKQLAVDNDKAKYILVHAGNNEQFFIQEWQNTTYPLVKRGYALFSLCYSYMLKKQSTKLIATLSPSFDTEANVFLRYVMAAYLVAAAGKKAQDEWLKELLSVLADHSSLQDEFGKMQPYTNDSDIQLYTLKMLFRANPDMLEQHIEPLINTLPDVDILKRLTYFELIFAVLFKKKTALKDITPMRKKALLVAADEVEKDPGFVNRKEIFDQYNIPHDASKLKNLAK
ncbi:Antitoxin component YwqK of the YwqJK toxin-antitoxin module [Chitinophaga sp. YR573]|uniref:hypothetical protein n=1 Tax=Chitinophaga sp. YR573 TaxID=1881040 RepID=UPI0008B9A646|nr:hypothetical protein [Chitinophaga sp. YR573]SEW39348.1 Antitoxin component YwqK of the YwqJK toxin-antitoxin module [Chitinophaga sp. YR573]